MTGATSPGLLLWKELDKKYEAYSDSNNRSGEHGQDYKNPKGSIELGEASEWLSFPLLEPLQYSHWMFLFLLA